jgi:putative transposase
MRRVEHTHHVRFLTFSTYRRLALFGNAKIRDRFAEHLADAKRRHGFHLYAWVLMPEHVHLLMWPEVEEHPISRVLHSLKRLFSLEVLARWRELRAPILGQLLTPEGKERFWQYGGGHDRNIFSKDELDEKIAYIHQNPVERGLCARPEDWAWSSARWYSGDRSSIVTIDDLPPKRPVRGATS